MPVSEAYFEVGAMKAKYPPELQRTESKRRAKKSIVYERKSGAVVGADEVPAPHLSSRLIG